jgi:arylsulfatase A-like enzyme
MTQRAVAGRPVAGGRPEAKSRVPGKTRRRAVQALLVSFALGLASLAPAPDARAQAPRPNIVLIVTDDQRWDSLWAMPTVRAELVGRGVTFENAMVTNAWCCPSRASILTGRYSHGTGVYTNGGTHGGFGAFDDDSTVATWLRNAGYRTGLFGKYFNGYGGTYRPPGWNQFVAFAAGGTANGGGAYFDYELNANGTLTQFGSAATDYSTDVLARKAARFIRRTKAGKPLFLLFTPFAPHGPRTPAPRHESAFTDLTFGPPPSYDEEDVSDKPAYVQNLPRLAAGDLHTQLQVEAGRALLAVDDAIASILDALRSTGRLADTVVVLMSDNGLAAGEHRWQTKQVPYEESIRIPLVVRYDQLGQAARTDPSLVLNVDIAPTLPELAGAAPDRVEGRSLRPLLAAPATPWRQDFLIEHLKGASLDPVPTYCAVRTTNAKYVSYATGEQEFYDLEADPYELANGVALPANAERVAALRSRLQTLCDPPPPGFDTVPGF